MSGSEEFEAIPESAIADEGTLTLAVPKTSDILEKAADLIEPEGRWTTRVFGRRLDGVGDEYDHRWVHGSDCFCADGAIAAALGVNPIEAKIWLTVEHGYLVQALGSGWTSVPVWNDAPERTQAEVVAKLREAAALAREQGQ